MFKYVGEVGTETEGQDILMDEVLANIAKVGMDFNLKDKDDAKRVFILTNRKRERDNKI